MREDTVTAVVRTGVAAAARALRCPRYEVLPLAGAAEDVQEHVPRDLPVTVTSSPRRGLEPTLELAETLSRVGYPAVPHLSARLVRDEGHLREILDRIEAAGIRDVFVVGGDGGPIGDFADSCALLVAMNRLRAPGPGRSLGHLGVAGYPHGHPLIADAELTSALRAKQSLATYVVSQMCFDPTAISTWLTRVRLLGVTLPVYVGIPGVADKRKLLRIAGRIGVGPSARFLGRHRHALVRLSRPGGYRPDRLVRSLATDMAQPARALVGLHVYTLGDVATTERWRRDMLRRLEADESRHA